MFSNKWRRNLAIRLKRIGVYVDSDISQLEFFDGVFDGELKEEVR